MGEAIVQVIFQDRILETVKLNKDVIVVGRLPENDIFINNLGVSRKHCRIIRDPSGNYHVEDLNSSNGTMVNGVRVTRGPLFSGDEVQIGKHKLVFQLTSKGVAGFFKDEEDRGRELWVGDRTVFTGASKPGPAAPSPASQPAVPRPAPVINITSAKAPPPPKVEPAPNFRARLEGRRFGVRVVLDGKTVDVRGLDEKDMTIGRDPSNDLVLDNLAVSVRHARIVHHDKQYVIEDLGSANGIRVNGVGVKRSPLYPGDEALIGRHNLVFDSAERIVAALGPAEITPVVRAPEYDSAPPENVPAAPPEEDFVETVDREKAPQASWNSKYSAQVELDGKKVATYALTKRVTCVGRLAENDIVIDNIGVSRLHAKIVIQDNDQVYIEDQDSANGITVNGLQLKRSPLYPGDVVQIMKHKIIFGLVKATQPEKAASGGRISVEAWRMDSTFMMSDEERQKKIGEWAERVSREKTEQDGKASENPADLAPPPAVKITPPPVVAQAKAPPTAPPERAKLFSEPTPLLSSARQNAKLILADGSVVRIEKDVFVVGKGEDADLKISGAFIKKHHTVIKREGATVWSVTNLGILKRIKVNGKAVKTTTLKTGDEITLDGLSCRFVIG